MECHTMSVNLGEARYNMKDLKGGNMNEQKQIEIENQYLGRPCWKTSGFKSIHTGVIRQVRQTGGWVEGHVFWQTKNGKKLETQQNSWERMANLGFEALPAFTTDLKYKSDPSPLHTQVYQSEDCQGLPEEDEVRITKTASTKEDIHQDPNWPKRDDQSEEANRYVNYRALLALIDNRKRDEWHVLQLNESLKRECCKPIKLKAFKMRVDKFEKSFERSLQNGNVYAFLRAAFNGEWHGPFDKTSIWSEY